LRQVSFANKKGNSREQFLKQTHLFKLISNDLWMLVQDMLFDERSCLEEFLTLLAPELALIFNSDMRFGNIAQFP